MVELASTTGGKADHVSGRTIGHHGGRPQHGSEEKGGQAPPSTHGPALSPRALMYLVPWSALSLLGLLCANVQVTTRLVGAACPSVYWAMADVLLQRGDPCSSWLGGERQRAWMIRYIGIFAIVGTVCLRDLIDGVSVL